MWLVEHMHLQERQLYVFDPKALHQIMVKDQDIFEETDSTIRGTRMSFGEGILSTLGEQHRKQRKMLNPVFAVSHLRQMVPLFFDVGKRNPKFKLDPKKWICSFGCLALRWNLSDKPDWVTASIQLTNDTISPYIQAVKNLQITMSGMALAGQYILPIVVNIGSPKFRRFIVNIVPWKNLHAARDIMDTLYGTAVHIYNIKKNALEEGDEAVSTQIAQGKDIISILMKDNSNASSMDRLSEEEIIGQASISLIPSRALKITSTLVFAATDTTSAALSRTLHILAQRPEVQEKLRKEIRSVQREGVDLSYDQLVSMEYLDAICRETLRLYPPVSFLTRIARKDVMLTMSTPITTVDGHKTTEIPIPADTGIIVSILASNRNPAIWGSDSLEWKPERWLSPLPKTVTDAHIPGIYSNLMTFNGGGRACMSEFSWASLNFD
ncbi:cytochrome P450 [Mycena galericulata]|nr:cytochrome P450 [Mycena galericulata]